MIDLIMDLENKSWMINGQPDSNTVVLNFYLDMVPGKTKIKNFDYYFGFSYDSKDEEDAVETFPEDDSLMPERENPTTFPYLANRHYVKNLKPGKLYTLTVTFKNLRQMVEDSYEVQIPFPEKPFENWIWDDEKYEWVPPLPPPSPIWDQESQKWIIP